MRKELYGMLPVLSLILIIFATVSIAGCGNVSRMMGAANILGKESDQLFYMTTDDVMKLVSRDVDLNRIKSDPEGVLGQYVIIRGKADMQGTSTFPLKIEGRQKKVEDSMVFILKDVVFVFTLKAYPEIKHGDEVEILGLVSKSRFIKETREMYPDSGIPDLVTIIAMDVKVVEKPKELPATKAPAGQDIKTKTGIEEQKDLDGDGKPG